MSTINHPAITSAAASYAALRHQGAPPWRAQVFLGLPAGLAARLEGRFQARRGGGPDSMKPAFARHDEHVRAAVAAGGFPVLACRGR